MKLAVALSFTLTLAALANAQETTGQPAHPDVAIEAHRKAVKLMEISVGRERLAASIPELIEKGQDAMRKQCPGCNPAFFTEWGTRMAARLKVDDFVNVAVRAYEKRFSDGELSELLTVASSRKTERPVTLSPALQKKLSAAMPAIMGEITGGCTEIGARLGGEVGAEIEKEHPDYVQTKPQPVK